MTTQSNPTTAQPEAFWTLPVKLLKGQFHHLDRFAVLNDRTQLAVEGHFSESKAQQASTVLNDHNKRYGHADTYSVAPMLARLPLQPAFACH